MSLPSCPVPPPILIAEDNIQRKHQSKNCTEVVFEGEGGGCIQGSADLPRNGTDSFHDLSSEWIKSILCDINGDYFKSIDAEDHPNHSLLLDDANAYQAFRDEIRFKPTADHHTNQLPQIYPEGGIVLKGGYGSDPNLILSCNPSLFNLGCFSLLLRVFVTKESRSIATMGQSYRWFGLTPTHVTLNNQDQKFEIYGVKLNQWNEIFVSFNNPQPEYENEELKNSNTAKEILLIVNGREMSIPLSCDMSIATANERVRAFDKELSFVNYSNGASLIGLVSSVVLLNKSCQHLEELKSVGKKLLEKHKKPSKTFSEALDSVSKVKVVHPDHVESVAQFDAAITENRLVVVDFFATWCCPCKGIAPFFASLAGKYQNAKFLKVDVDQVPDLSSRFEVNCMPTFLFLRDGESAVTRLEGANEKELENKVIELVSKI
ncbi:hypothetical protein C9374_008780 [Naegleria lovaniensis]|uniref:Thioredoxin domain-containing protein n=1 Tax=Naegleria lovaniensis TaxID=51637 RepID=A0AA88GL49_NAELO|nr:uncharacterized protein C9374_008780 [Naegleria lovaniensis]KAG2378158.1 hypothetical protein C9374_008780 [Naegleria lovaniensis]